MSDRAIDIMDMALSLFIAYWAIRFSQYVLEIIFLVIKLLATEAILS